MAYDNKDTHIWVVCKRLTNSRFCVQWANMNHPEVHLMLSSRLVDSKLQMMTIQFEYYFFLIKRKMANVPLKIFDVSFWCKS